MALSADTCLPYDGETSLVERFPLSAIRAVATKIFYDSSSIQFWGSEKYRRGIPLLEWSDRTSFLTEEVLAEYTNTAKDLNREGQGDQCGFLLYKP